MPPGVGGQAGFQAGLLKKLFAVPVPFLGHLRQEEPAASAARNQQSMPSHFDLLGSNIHQRGKYGNLDMQGGKFGGLNGVEAGVVKSCGARRIRAR